MNFDSDREVRKALALWMASSSTSDKLDQFKAYNKPSALEDCTEIYQSKGNIWPGSGEPILPNRTNWHMCRERGKMYKKFGNIWDYSGNMCKRVIQPSVASSLLEFSNDELEEFRRFFQDN